MCLTAMRLTANHLTAYFSLMQEELCDNTYCTERQIIPMLYEIFLSKSTPQSERFTNYIKKTICEKLSIIN